MEKKNHKYLISIVVPVYNAEMYLVRCLDSIINQEYKNIEIILVNDGSVDSSGDICDDYAQRDRRIKVLHKKNEGPGAARNAGIKMANGEYICFVDSDDWIELNMYSYLLEKSLFYDADIVSSLFVLSNGKKVINNEKEVIKIFKDDEKISVYLESGMMSRQSEYSTCNKIYKKNLFDDIRFPINQIYEDVVINLQLIDKANKLVQSNKILYHYYQGGKSITRNGFKQADFDLIMVGQQTVDFVSTKKNKENIKLAKMKHARTYFSLLTKISVYGYNEDFKDRVEASKYLKDKLKENYFFLLKSEMQISRKIIMTFLCIDHRIISIPAKIYKIILKISKNFTKKMKGGY